MPLTLLGRGWRHPTLSGGKKILFGAARVGRVTYSSALTLEILPSGLRLSVMRPMNRLHPPLFVPWTDITLGMTSTMCMHRARPVLALLLAVAAGGCGIVGGGRAERCAERAGRDEPQRYEPIRRAAPTYPVRARERGIEGHVKMTFEVDDEGRARAIRIIESDPPGTFDRAASVALSKFRYCPAGSVEYPSPMRIKLQFRLSFSDGPSGRPKPPMRPPNVMIREFRVTRGPQPVDGEDSIALTEQHRSSLAHCFWKNPPHKGAASVSFKLLRDGRTSDVSIRESTIQGEPTAQCVQEAISQWELAKGFGDRPRVSFKFSVGESLEDSIADELDRATE